MMTLQEIATALGRARKTAGGYLCSCPCHDDQHASLSITQSVARSRALRVALVHDPRNAAAVQLA